MPARATKSFVDFGASPGGVIPATSSIVAALNSGYAIVQEGGVFLIDAEIVVSAVVNLTMTAGAKIIIAAAATPARSLLFSAAGNVVSGLRVEGFATSDVVKFAGANNRIDDIYIDGVGMTKYGLWLENPAESVVSRPVVKNCQGPATVYPGIGIFSTGNVDGLKIIDPRISDIYAPQGGDIGSSPGACAAIAVNTNLSSGSLSIISGTLERIVGREGDAINCQSSSASDNFKVIVDGVEVIDSNRRAVKLQNGVARVSGVRHRTITLTQADIPIGNSSITTFGRDVEVSGCDVDARFFDFGIIVAYATKGLVHNNTVLSGQNGSSTPGWTTRSSQSGIYVTNTYGFAVSDNVVEGGYYGIRFSNSYQYAGCDNHVTASKMAHMYIDSNTSDGAVYRNHFYESAAGNVGSYGVHIRGQNCRAIGNESSISHPGTKTHNTVFLESPASKNTVRGNSSNASYVTIANSGSTNNRIFDNQNTGTGGVGVSALLAAGDANASAPAAPYATIAYSVPITADRTVSVSGYPHAGDVLRVCRATAATGAFSVIVGASLKSLAAGQWAEITYDGVAWSLTASGSL